MPLMPVGTGASLSSASASAAPSLLSSGGLFAGLVAGGAILGGALGFLQTSERNRAIKEQAVFDQQRLNTNLKRERLKFADETSIASQQAQFAVGNVRNGLGFASGISLNTHMAQIVTDVEQDQIARRIGLDQIEEAIEIERKSVLANADSQTVSPFFGALTGALGGAQQGLGIASGVRAIDQANLQGYSVEQQNRLFKLDESLLQSRLVAAQTSARLNTARHAIAVSNFTRVEGFTPGNLNNLTSLLR